MKQFTPQQILAAKEKVTPDIMQRLIENNRDVISHDILVPETGCATWNHYFFCPEHSVRLLWDRHSPNKHRCPVDGAVFTGEPYYGGWWRWLNGLNAKACYELAVLWLLTDDKRWCDNVIEILMQYARFYPGYEEHGGIPYNGPGKANAQTLCEANCHADFVRGFDIVRGELSAQQETYIADRLLREGAEFLIRHRSNQIHNHEVKINATIGMTGVVLNEARYLEFAVNSEYGLRYQLENALLPGGLWFEGSLHYHYYALQAFMAFEKFACQSRFSLLEHPYYRDMLTLPLTLLMPDMTLPKVNDCVNGQEKLGHSDIYEFAYHYYGTNEYGQLLAHLYRTEPRHTIDALFYGRPLPAEPLAVSQSNEHNPGAGFTLIRNTPDRAICLKHGPYGGEHDHYDRLNLIVFNNGKALFPDLGTTGYGAPLHYGYYKNSFSHNTLCVNGLNQPPAIPRIIHYEESAGETRLIVEVDWKTEAKLPDSKTRVEWDCASYRDIVFRRSLLVTGNLLIDKWEIENPHQQCVDAVYLINGSASRATNQTALSICYPYIRHATQQPLAGQIDISCQAETPVTLSCCCPQNAILIQAQGPNNPSTSMIDYLIARSHEKQVSYLFVTDFSGESSVQISATGQTFNVSDSRLNRDYLL
ncbi:heparinase II/III family protein [Scandinavium sp. H11S7]|uniref:heparinase II/III domain-containing protein n=1 Tax=Scandinavium hiltneri TaxID=2926519 RepID=UPI00216576E3|nr:heparinase II/III family protein [Scandinavium hiltneri]MCS2158271.1 heparinase II/III family protein [Scandinavium hiltneri]